MPCVKIPKKQIYKKSRKLHPSVIEVEGEGYYCTPCNLRLQLTSGGVYGWLRSWGYQVRHV